MKKFTALIRNDLHSIIFTSNSLLSVISIMLIIYYMIILMIYSKANNEVILKTVTISILITQILSSSLISSENSSLRVKIRAYILNGVSPYQFVLAKFFSAYFTISFSAFVLILSALAGDVKLINWTQFVAILLGCMNSSALAVFSSIITASINGKEAVSAMVVAPLSMGYFLYLSSIISSAISLADFNILLALSLIIVPITILACGYLISKL